MSNRVKCFFCRKWVNRFAVQFTRGKPHLVKGEIFGFSYKTCQACVREDSKILYRASIVDAELNGRLHQLLKGMITHLGEQ